MRVGIDLQTVSGERTGVGYYAYCLAKYLPSLSPSDSFIGLSLGGRVKELRKLEQPNFKICRSGFIPARAVSFFWKTLDWPPADLFTGAVDVFHFPSFVARPLRSGRAVATIHDLAFRRMPECSEPKNAAFLNRHVPRTLERASLVIVDSAFTARELAECYGYPEKKIRVIPLGVEEIFNPRATLSAALRRALPEGYMLFVGAIEPRKNICTLVEAYALLRGTGKKLPALVLAGPDGWRGEWERVARLIETLDLCESVIRLNYVAAGDLPGLYAAARLFVFPALYEGFGLPPLEAMASGVPVVCSDAGSLPEVAGDAALLVPPRDAELLAKSIGNVLDDYTMSAALIKKGLARVKQFSWSDAACDTLRAYRDALGNRL